MAYLISRVTCHANHPDLIHSITNTRVHFNILHNQTTLHLYNYKSMEYTVSFPMPLRGYHVYMKSWTPVIGQEIKLKLEEDNPYDKFAITGNWSESTVERVPKELSKILHPIIASSTIRTLVVVADDKKVKSTRGKGLEIVLNVTVSGSKDDRKLLQSFTIR